MRVRVHQESELNNICGTVHVLHLHVVVHNVEL